MTDSSQVLTVELRVLVSRAVGYSMALLGAVFVVICEDWLPDGTWRDVVDAVNEGHPPRALIATSSFAEPRLWSEVLKLGGYDGFAHPFSPDEVLEAYKRYIRKARRLEAALRAPLSRIGPALALQEGESQMSTF